MSDETTQFIIGDAALDATSQRPRRRWFGRRKNPPPPLTHCENCQAPLAGPYCAQCGQHAIDYRRSLITVLIDALDSFFDWDTKFIRSIGVLLARPWKLTNDFNAGRRVRYMHPLRLYLLASIAFFLLARLINLAPSGPVVLSETDRAEIDSALSQLTSPDSPLTPAQRAKVEEARAKFGSIDASANPEERAKATKLVSHLARFADKKQLKAKDAAKIDALLERVPDAPTPPETVDEGLSAQLPPPAQPSPSTTPKHGSVIQFDNPDAEKNPMGAWMEKRIKEKIGEDGTKAQLFLDTLRSNIPTMMLFCIPLFALLLKIIYIFQRRFYIEHLVYALHIHTFAYTAAVVISLTAMASERWAPALTGWLIGILCCIVVVQVFLSIRRVYRQGWFFTLFKFSFGGVVYLVILSVAIGATAFITLLLP